MKKTAIDSQTVENQVVYLHPLCSSVIVDCNLSRKVQSHRPANAIQVFFGELLGVCACVTILVSLCEVFVSTNQSIDESTLMYFVSNTFHCVINLTVNNFCSFIQSLPFSAYNL